MPVGIELTIEPRGENWRGIDHRQGPELQLPDHGGLKTTPRNPLTIRAPEPKRAQGYGRSDSQAGPIEFRGCDAFEEVVQGPSWGCMRPTQNEHFAFEHRTKRIEHLAYTGRRASQHLLGDAERRPMAASARNFRCTNGAASNDTAIMSDAVPNT